MDKKEILQFADILKWEFFTRLKDETKPAKKEFSYIDLLNLLDTAYRQVGISKDDRDCYEKSKPKNLDILNAALSTSYVGIKFQYPKESDEDEDF